MVALQEYTDLQTMRTYLSLKSTENDGLLKEAIASASREVDKRCNRYFGKSESASERTFDVEGSGIVFIDDALPESLEVPLSGFTALPRGGIVDGIPGHPITRIKSAWLCEGDTVTVSAVWGWPEVPEVVREATKMLAAETLMQKDTPLGIKGMDEFGTIRMRDRQTIISKLGLYDKFRVTGL